MDNFNDPADKDFIRNLEGMDEDSIIPINFEVIAKDQTYLAASKDPDSMRESISSISEAYKSFGKEYGIDIKFDIDSVSETFNSITNNYSEKVFNLYLVKSYSKMRLAIFNKILISIGTLVDRITQKDILESDNIEMSVGLLEKLFEMMERANKIHKEIKVESADLLLKNLSKEISSSRNGSASAELDNKEVGDVLRVLRKTTVKSIE